MNFNIDYMPIVGLTAISFAFGFLYFQSLIKLKQSVKINTDLFFTTHALEQFKDLEQSEEVPDIHKENFIKFLSDSRDWAFEYIEEVQNGLNNFIKEVEPDIEYYKEYGVVIEGMNPSHDKALKKISIEFEKLKELLPKDKDDRR